MPTFSIDGRTLDARVDPRESGRIQISSVPRPYQVAWKDGVLRQDVDDEIRSAVHPIVLIDEYVSQTILHDCQFMKGGIPILTLRASEETKTVYSALDVCAFLQTHSATRGSMLFVIGGGVLQDVGAFAAAAYKRGIPWTYIPTTLLAQGDSCIGGKTGLNHDGIKNLIALFSAPARVVIHPQFLSTLSDIDIRSGLGEIFRLHVTGGNEFLERYDNLAPALLAGDQHIASDLIAGSLSVKRAVVEVDEFELNVRKAMNYGHSIGHAFEALTKNAIPHGIAVVVGILVENELAVELAGLTECEAAHMAHSARALVPPEAIKIARDIDVSTISDVLLKDKKAVGKTLKLACQSAIGSMEFVDLPLDGETSDLVRDATSKALARVAAA